MESVPLLASPPPRRLFLLSACRHEAAKSHLRLDIARRRPSREFGNINPSISYFAVMYPALRLAEPFTQVSLRQFRFLSQRTKESLDWFVSRGMLRFGRHPRRR
jgi:hypothetical protein